VGTSVRRNSTIGCSHIGTSIATIARAITGTAWSGPRFFGLRAGADRREDRLEFSNYTELNCRNQRSMSKGRRTFP
jgi:Protein of unknown function (DUF2924)